MSTRDLILSEYIQSEKLPDSYFDFALKWFIPLTEALAAHQNNAGKTIFIGVNGSQGSGKSTVTGLLVELLSRVFDKPSIGMSIDDFYLSKQKRLALSENIHPLFATRGVPGTHDTALLASSIDALLQNQACVLPVFIKSIDDVAPTSQWRDINQKYDIVILEGWCVGINAQSNQQLTQAVNSMEETQDPNGDWRAYVNKALASDYHEIFAKMDQLVMLKAPSFDCVYQWRCEQEHKLIERLKQQNLPTEQTMTDEQIDAFIQHYQRLTEHALEILPSRSDFVFELDKNRGIHSCQTN
ncbi:kinase [Glaciecola sp. 2405UD65-10]|uniref:kinase n=1 Tax=Glaciecola sp. 2405UD65-10 TaxID=3397244 RepID=UPI003B58FA76